MSTEKFSEITVHNHVTVVALGAEFKNLDEPDVNVLQKELLDIAETMEPPLLVIDLSHTEFFGSAFLEVLFRVWRRIQKRDRGRFAISGLTTYCREVITVTHMDRVWDVFSTREDAVHALSKNA